jgi:TPR repeat protein
MFMMVQNGNKYAAEYLKYFPETDDIVCLGYSKLFPILLNFVLIDLEQSASIAREIVQQLNRKIRSDFWLSFLPMETRFQRKYGQLDHHELYLLGQFFFLGVGVIKDQSLSSKLLSQSAIWNSAAQWSLDQSEMERNPIMEYYRLASEQGNPAAQFRVGIYFERGLGIVRNESEAIRLFILSSNQGYAAAQFQLGVCYTRGFGVVRNQSEAVRLYTLASNQGYNPAHIRLGACYEHSLGVVGNKEEAFRLYILATVQSGQKFLYKLEVCPHGLGIRFNQPSLNWLLLHRENPEIKTYLEMLRSTFGASCLLDF